MKDSFAKYYQGDRSKYETGGVLSGMEGMRNASGSILRIKGSRFGKRRNLI
jgi:hypothetical protein